MLSGWLLTGFRKGVKTVCCSFLIGIELDSDENGRTEMQFKPLGFKLIAIQVSFLDRTLSHTSHIIYKFPVPVQCWLSFGNCVLSGVWWLTTLSASKARILCNLELLPHLRHAQIFKGFTLKRKPSSSDLSASALSAARVSTLSDFSFCKAFHSALPNEIWHFYHSHPLVCRFNFRGLGNVYTA